MGLLRSIKPSMIENGMEAAVGGRIMADRIKFEAVKDRVVELLKREEVLIGGEAIRAEVVT